MSTPFSDALALTAAEGGFDAVLTDAWTIGTKAHGGVLLALCAKAATLGLDVPGAAPLAVSASYLAAPDPGPVTLAVDVRKRGRSASLVDVELRRGERVAVRAAVTLGTPDTTEPLHVSTRTGQPVEPPEDAIDVRSSPLGAVISLASVCELRLDRATAAFAEGRVDGSAEIRLWVRPLGEDPDVLFALVAGDVSPPVTLNLGRVGWAPTVQLTALVRAVPVPGWLRVQMSSRCVGGTWFDEDAVVHDSAGTLVCQTRQLAMVPTG